jgi:alkylation response protein AidB-like acyl-CoA dehydrogenase
MMVNIQANRFARVCYEEAFKYACKRETFDKKLIEHPVIREKLAHMIKKIESTHALLERYY